MKTCKQCKANFEKWDNTSVAEEYCPQCVVFILLLERLGVPEKVVDFEVQLD